MKVKDILTALDQIAPQDAAFEFDKVGIQIGSLESEVKTAVVSLDRSLAAIDYAISLNAELLVCHHPLIWNPLTRICKEDHVGLSVTRLIENHINFIAVHTNWDCAIGGVNDVLAKKVGLHSVESFGDYHLEGYPICRIGDLENNTKFADLVKHVDFQLNTKSLAWGASSDPISRVAVIGGAGSSEWLEAKINGAEALITGEIRHSDALEALESGVRVIAAGHYATEQPGCSELTLRLQAEIPSINWRLFEPKPGEGGRPFSI